jgi:hypothetical protein
VDLIHADLDPNGLEGHQVVLPVKGCLSVIAAPKDFHQAKILGDEHVFLQGL